MKRTACSIAVLALVSGVAFGEPTRFGERTIEVVAPDDFHGLAAKHRDLITTAQGYLPMGTRLVDQFASAADFAKLEAGTPVDLNPYFQLQALRVLDGKLVDAAVGNAWLAGIEKELGSAATVEQTIDEITKQGNNAAQRRGLDANVKIGQPMNTSVLSRGPSAWLVTLEVPLSAGRDGKGPEVIVGSGGAVLVNHQLVILYAYRHYEDASSRAWTEASVKRWAEKLRAANPDDSSLAATSISTQARKVGEIVGAAAGLLIALALFRRKNGPRGSAAQLGSAVSARDVDVSR